MTYETIRYDVQDRVATITFNRPGQLNAISPVMAGELRHAYAAAEADDQVWIVGNRRTRPRQVRLENTICAHEGPCQTVKDSPRIVTQRKLRT